MQSFITSRNMALTYRRTGTGNPLVCVPGGPLLSAGYLGDLGGLTQDAELILFDPPGSEGDTEKDPAAYRCDNVANDLEQLRLHLGLDRLDLLAHSAGANIVCRYLERYPERVGRVLLVSPSTRAVGIDIPDDARSAVARRRSAEPWYPAAAAALARIRSGEAAEDDWSAIAPFSYRRWNRAAADYDAQMNAARNPIAAAAFGADGAFDPLSTRTALAGLRVPVSVIAGAVDVGLPLQAMQELVDLFQDARLEVQPDAGHFPWFDDADTFVATARRALDLDDA